MKLSLGFLFVAALTTNAIAEEGTPSIGKSLDKKADALKAAAKSKLPKKDASKANEPSAADKAKLKAEELKKQAAATAEAAKQKVEAKKAELSAPSSEPSAQDKAKAAVGKADKKADDLIKSFGK